MASEHEIQKKNLEADLALVRSEIDEKAKELTSILLHIDSHKAAKAALEKDRVAFEEYKKKSSEEIALKRNEMQTEKTNHDLSIVEAKKNLEDAKKEVKEANRELAWINEKIMHGQDELDSMLKSKLALDEEIAQLVVLVSHKEEEQKKHDDLVAARESIEIALHEKTVQTDENVSKSLAEVSKLDEELKTKIAERDRLQFEVKTYTDQLYTAMNDWHAVRTRLELRFKEHYPELELPLMA